ncbi:MAG TPA: response regulator [Phycisphaerae bacterium]|jgi:putative two-component system response regulator
MQVLIVDDDDFALDVLTNTLSRMGFSAVPATDGIQAMEILRRGEIRLVITDWDMPNMNGLELCRAIRKEDLSGYVYVIMLTAREGNRQRMEGLCAGADDFLNKPLDPEELLVCLKTSERILALETRDVALFALAKLAESRDTETGDHIERVQSYTRIIARNLSDDIKAGHGVDDEYIRLLYQTSPLHDLGKVGIPDAILLKPDRLTPDEFAVMKTHTIIGAETLDAALRRFPNARFLQMAREIAATHHERFDGTGYPNGLAGQQIPLCGRIVAVADVYDALCSRRVYKSAMSHEQAMTIILQGQGTHFDPEVVQAFVRAEEQIIAVRESLRNEGELVSAPRVTLPTTPALVQCGPIACNILVAEDDPLVMDHLIELLSVTGERVFPATNGVDALRIFDEHGPRVIVSDWVMPEMDGVQLCRAIRSRVDAPPAHFIMLTAHTDKARLLDAYQAGADDFVSKPFDQEVLLARVRAGIRTAKLRDELVRKASGSQALNAQLATMNTRLERLAVTDELTGLSNRRHGMSRLTEQWNLFERYTKPLTIAMIDIDHFKQINDTYGHAAGDAILRQVSGILRKNTRGTDTICRFGGDEFLVIFPSQTVEEALVCANRCLREVAAGESNPDAGGAKTSISVGVATRTPPMAHVTDLLKAADQALYAAKNNGRHLVCVAEAYTPELVDAPARDILPAPAMPHAAPASEGPRPIDPAALLKRCGGDPKFAAAVTKRFQSQAGVEVAKIQQALTRNDAETLSRTAHSLKSMSAYMAADSAAELARQIESLGRADHLADVIPLLDSLRAEIDRTIEWIAQNKGEAALTPRADSFKTPQ